MSAPWMEGLDDQDWAFIRRFLLASGSLKEVAREYGISYPTVRLRLDRLIDKIRILDDGQARGPFEQALRLCFAEGRIDEKTMVRLREVHERTKKEGYS